MLETFIEMKNKEESSPSAFIFYIPPTSHTKENIFYNEEAYKIILSNQTNKQAETRTIDLSEISSLCAKWHKLIDMEYREDLESNPDAQTKPLYIGILKSHRRKYIVKAVVLTKKSSKKNERNYLFLLERIIPENLNLIKIIREYKLSNREQEILHLLIKGYSNKEIAYELNLSLNTIKTYMRLLMNKFNVNNRSSIIADLLKKGG